LTQEAGAIRTYLSYASVVVKDLRLKDKDKDKNFKVQERGQGRGVKLQGQGQGLYVQGRGQGQGLTPALIHTWFSMCNMKNNTFKTLFFLKVI